MKRILITGADGFAGRNLAESLARSFGPAAVIPAGRKVLDLLDADAVRAFIRNEGISTVVHCANIGGTRKTGYDAGATDVVSDNLRMFLNLARCLTPEMRMINLGSGAEYDHRAYVPKMKEDYFDVNVPSDPYGFSKYAISKYIERADNIICLRIFGLFGKYEDYTFKFISNAIVKTLLGLPVVINQNVVFDYLYVDDFSRIVEKFIKQPTKYRHCNVTPSESMDLLSLAGLINRVADTKAEVRVLNPGANREYTGSNARLLAELPGFEFTSYAAAVKTLYEYYRRNLDSLDIAAVKADPFLKNCRTSK